MNTIDSLDKTKLPQHLAIIMDGNGRWAKKQGLMRVIGHENGAKSVNDVVQNCAKIGLKYLTLYAFSTENWNRPKSEVNKLMRLLVSSLKKEEKRLHKNEIKLNAIGNLSKLPVEVLDDLNKVMDKTKDNKHMVLTVALSYGAKEELVMAVKNIVNKVKNNIICENTIDEMTINQHLYTHNLPDVDLLVRTSGEHRISNFLLWQSAYAEFYFTDVLWPDFREQHLVEALLNYQNRERRFGKTSEQL